MRPASHLAMSSLIAGGSFVATQSPAIALATLAAGFLIDGDHLFDYALYCYQRKKRPSFREFFYSACYPPPTRIYVLLHSYELLLPIWLLAFFFSALPWAIWLSLAFVGHLLMDYWAYHPHPLCHFFTFRMIRGFSFDEVWRNNPKIQGNQRSKAVAMERSRYDRGYSLRPFELRVPGDALKDRIILKAIDKTNHKDKRLLDLGCGMGYTAALFSNQLYVVGVDFSQQALRVAQQRVGKPFICGDAQALPFPDNAFHYVIIKDLLEHVADDRRVVSEVFRVCQPGGRVIMYLPCELSGINLSTESLVKKLTGYTLDPEVGHLRRYTPKQAKQMLQSQGFKPVRVWYFVHFSLGVASLLSVMGYKLLSQGKREGEKVVSGPSLTLVGFIFRLFELLGRMESWALKSFPGAGFFIEAEVVK